MTKDEFRAICNSVTDQMRDHTRPFVTGLSQRTGSYRKLVGSGSYVLRNERRLLLTCEHVGRFQNLEHRFWDDTTDYLVREPFTQRSVPDVAWSMVPEDMWDAVACKAEAIPYERFDVKHSPVSSLELLFFRGFAGENAHDDLIDFRTNGSGYCSQQIRDAKPSEQFFEIFWEPENTSTTTGTTEEARATMRFTHPAGFSGSLVWNTRRMEAHDAGREWHPSQATVTGMVVRYDASTKSVLALRVEYIRAELERTARS